MPPTYPHMRTKGDFPDVDGVNVYKYDNQLDYRRFDYSQMEICVCRVPWDMGEAHVGQRTISGIGNVVYFEDEAARDAWFDAIPDTECFRWETKYRELHRDMRINVPLPFDIAARYNYVYIRYHLFANDDSTLEYEGESGVREWFYFVREVNFIAPNTTELVLMDDAWQTWIYDVDVTGMVLERGHAPMFATKADKYLENPVENNDGLLTEDVNYGELQKVSDISAVSLNENNMYACIAMSCNPWSEWGKKAGDWSDDNWEDSDWRVASSAGHITTSHVPAFRVIGIPYDDFNAFCDDVYEQAPQFKQTWQGVFFVSADYLTFGNHGVDTLPEDGHFELFGHTVWILSGIRKTTFDLTTLTKEKFGYPAEYADVAKLYTFPYAAIELTDEKGESTLVKVEETTGKLDITVAANMVFPYINLRGTVGGIGGAKSAKVNFVNLVSQNVTVEGRWYDHVREWKIPCFAVMISAAKVNDYAQHYDRVQKRVEYENTKKNMDAQALATCNANKNTATAQQGNENAMATANRGNQNALADANKAMADNQADNVTDNAAAQVTANNSILSNSNSAALTDKDYVNGLATALQAWEAGYTRDSTNNEVDAKNASANIAATSAVANGAVSGAVSAATNVGAGNVIGAVAGAIGGVASGAISGATTLASNAVAVNLLSTQAETLIGFTQNKLTETTGNNTDRTTNQNSANTKNKNATNTMINTSASNTASMTKENASTQQSMLKANATRSYNAATGNATRSYDAATENADNIYTMQTGVNENNQTTAQKAIRNSIKTARMEPASIFGSFDNADTATTAPMAMFANIVTESDSAIISAGDQFLRYGYEYEHQWKFDGNWNIGAHFTYWKLSDFWVRGLQVPDLYMDKLRFFLYGGVTVWRKPEDIGNVTIYENWG